MARICRVAESPVKETALLPSELRRQRARIAGYALAAQRDPLEYTAAGRASFMARFEREVDPEGVLPPKERARRAEAAKRAHFSRLAYKSAQARARRKSQ